MNKSLIKNLARKLKKMRKAKGLKLRDVSEMTNLTQSHLSMIENAKTTPSLQTLITLADFHQVDLAALFTSVEPKKILHFDRSSNTTISADSTHSLHLIAGQHLPDQQKIMIGSIEKGGQFSITFSSSGMVVIILLIGSLTVDLGASTNSLRAMESLLLERDGPITFISEEERSICIIIQYS